MLLRRAIVVILTLIFIGSPVAADGRHGLKFKLASDQAMRFGEIATEGHLSIYASGEFTVGDSDRFATFVRDNQIEMAKVVFDSPGGSLFEGVKLGKMLRSLHFDTDIGNEEGRPGESSKAICASACAYAYAGGTLRFMPEGGRLGLHQFRSSSGAGVSESDAQTISGILVSYLSDMGVDANAFAIASITDSNGIVWLSYDDALAYKFVNTGVSPTTADLKMVDMRPYLRLNQVKPEATLRVLLMCWKGRIAIQAGIVTDQHQSKGVADSEWTKRSYLELDSAEFLALPGIEGLEVQDSTIWVRRALDPAQVNALLAARDLGIWLDGFGMVRFGGTMDLRHVHDATAEYVRQCKATK